MEEKKETKKFNIQKIAEDMVNYIIVILNGKEKDKEESKNEERVPPTSNDNIEIVYASPKTNKNIHPAPKKFRGDFIPMLRSTSQEILCEIVMANNMAIDGEGSDEFTRNERKNNQNLALGRCAVLDCILHSAQIAGCINKHQFEVATSHTYRLSCSLRKWINGDKSRLKDNKDKDKKYDLNLVVKPD